MAGESGVQLAEVADALTQLVVGSNAINDAAADELQYWDNVATNVLRKSSECGKVFEVVSDPGTTGEFISEIFNSGQLTRVKNEYRR